MRILHVLTSDKLSGAENVVADICMMFEGEYDMAYCSLDGSIREALEDRKVEFLPLEKLNVAEIKRNIQLFKPDILHAHDIRASVLSTFAGGNIPIVSHIHGNIDDMKKINLKSVSYMMTNKKMKAVISVSQSILEDYIFRKSIEKKTTFLQNVLHSPRIEKLLAKDTDEYDFDFSYIGRLSYPKNPQRVAQVASNVLKKCTSVTFGVIGDGDLKSEMEAVFREEGVVDRVVFTGNLPYPYKALKQSKCMLMCSRYEGTPIAALEAMALGVPIVSTPVDGMNDLVEHEHSGFLSSVDEELTQAVIDLLSNEELQREMSEKSITRFKNLNREREYIYRLNEVYKHTVTT